MGTMQRVWAPLRLLVLMGAVLLFGFGRAATAESLTVFAASSLQESLTRVGADFQARTGTAVTLSFAASSALARQIEAGAPADLFVSADLAWMDHLDKAGALAAGSRINLLGNRLVLVAPRNAPVALTIAPGFDLAGALGPERLAMGNVTSVPAGVYGKAALQSLGVWASVEGKIAQAENVRAALLLVSRREAPLGIVYETDTRVDPGVTIVGRFPETSHPPIVYPAALLKSAHAPQAQAFLAYLQSPEAARVFSDAGFTVLAKTP